MILMLASLKAISQTEQKRDSLLKLARTAPSDTAKVWALMEIGKLYTDRNVDSSLLFLQQALVLAEKISFEKGIARCRINKANAIYNLGKYDEAIELDLSILPLCEKLGLGKEKVAIYNLVGNAWNQRGSYWLAIDYYDKALEAMKGAAVPPHFPVVVNANIAIIYNGLKLYEKGRQYATKSYEQAKALGDDITCATACQHVGNSLLGMNRDDEALHWFEQSLAYAKKAEYHAVITNSLGIIADLELNKGNLTTAEGHYNEAYSIAKEHDDAYGQMTILHGYGQLYFQKKQFEKSADYCRQSLSIAEKLKLDDYRAMILLSLSDLALVQGDFSKWDQYRQAYQDIRDTVNSQALVHAVQELETKYQTQDKEERIQDLERDKELQNLRIQRQRSLVWGTAILSILVLVAMLLAWQFQKNKALLATQQITIQAHTIKELEQEKQIATASAVLRGQEEERGRLARDLHEGLGGMLSGIKQTLFTMNSNNVLIGISATSFTQVIEDMDRSIEELRHIARNMMPEALVRFGLKDALEDYCDHTAQSTGLKVHFQAFGLENRLSQDIEVIVFRIAQELLNNIVKHAKAKQAIVQLIRDENRVNLTIEDDGIGMEIAELENCKGVGWMNIRSRVNYLEGRLDLHSNLGKGTSVGIEFEAKP